MKISSLQTARYEYSPKLPGMLRNGIADICVKEGEENDIKKIEEEIEYRKLVVRKEAIEAVKEARAHGDLSENFE